MSRAGIAQEGPDNCEVYNWSFSQQAFDDEVQRMLDRVRFRRAYYAR